MARRSSWGWGGYFKHTTTREIEQSARKAMNEAKKKGKEYHPVQIIGNKIAKTWWGSSWCSNLERYADYANRLPRGRTYVRHGAVVDLQLGKGEAHAKVQGSSLYKVDIQFDPLDPAQEKELGKICSEQIQNVEELLSGKFPTTLKDRFFAKGALFPSPREIHFHCSCPDWASMCKHVAAVMYGIGARLDDDPLKFFDLRGIQTEEFVARAVSNKVDSMLKNAAKESDRIIGDDQLEELFGLGLGDVSEVSFDPIPHENQAAEETRKTEPKRGRGRPRKDDRIQVAVQAKIQSAIQAAETWKTEKTEPKRSRGRPRKDAGVQTPAIQVAKVPETGKTEPKRGRGRPRKNLVSQPAVPDFRKEILRKGYSETIAQNLLLLCEKLQGETFGNARVVQILGCSAPTATVYVKRLYKELKLIVPVEGQGKGKYRFP